MRYYLLMYNYENDDDYVYCDIADIGNMDEYVTINGKEIEQWDKAVFEYNSVEGKILTDYLANVYRWFVVSDDFRRLTQENIKEQVQYLPVRVINRLTKAEVHSYFLANIVTVVDALDLQKSKYDVFEADDKRIISVEKYVLKGNKITGKHIFRLKDETIPIFVSERIKKIVEDNNLIGFSFLEVEVI